VPPTLRVLIIDDSPDDAALVVCALEQQYQVAWQRVASADALADAVDHARWDVAIADYTTAGFDGVEALDILRQRDADMPFLFVSNVRGEDAAVAAMRTGAHDYILKANLQRLLPSIERQLREAAARRERRRVDERVVYLAYHDALTDLPNRTLLQDRLSQSTRVAQREGSTVGLLVLDLNGFKEINDTHGHHVGDLVLQWAASRIRATVRDADTVARLGGDEFAVVLPLTDVEGALSTAQKIIHEIEQPCLVDHRSLNVRASLGVACFPEHGLTAEALLQKADVAMYVAKSDATGIAVYSPNRDPKAHRRLSLISELRRGLDEAQFFVEYQPMLHLRSNVIVGVEALVRWTHPKHGRLLPGDFIDLAEQTGLINPLTTIVIETAIREWAPRQKTPPLTIAVNLSPRTLQDPRLPQRIAAMRSGYDASSIPLAFEITENILMTDPARSMECLKRLHDMGLRLVIDDFGTGYSSLSYLRRLPVDELKIDRSFVAGLVSGHDEVIVRSTIDLAHNLGMTVVAEGVESADVQAQLLEMGCDVAQGTFISQPRRAEEMTAWMADHDLLGMM